MLKNLTRLISLGSAAQQTRAEVGTQKAELNPIHFYDEAGAGLLRLGAAADQTRADSPDGELELIPVQRWTMTGVRFH